ncbi:MAG: hypothetical protein LUE65_12820 [Clostridiales bacterium]|nr:hypothetical protein [Clostridiales bacterium]
MKKKGLRVVMTAALISAMMAGTAMAAGPCGFGNSCSSVGCGIGSCNFGCVAGNGFMSGCSGSSCGSLAGLLSSLTGCQGYDCFGNSCDTYDSCYGGCDSGWCRTDVLQPACGQ